MEGEVALSWLRRMNVEGEAPRRRRFEEVVVRHIGCAKVMAVHCVVMPIDSEYNSARAAHRGPKSKPNTQDEVEYKRRAGGQRLQVPFALAVAPGQARRHRAQLS